MIKHQVKDFDTFIKYLRRVTRNSSVRDHLCPWSFIWDNEIRDSLLKKEFGLPRGLGTRSAEICVSSCPPNDEIPLEQQVTKCWSHFLAKALNTNNNYDDLDRLMDYKKIIAGEKEL